MLAKPHLVGSAITLCAALALSPVHAKAEPFENDHAAGPVGGWHGDGRSAFAEGPDGGRSGSHYAWGGAGIALWGGPDYGWYDSYDYPYNANYGYAAPYHAASSPTTTTSAYWYYCANPAGYYPYVRQCPGVWRAMPAGG